MKKTTSPKRRPAAELIALVRAQGPQALDELTWLDEIVDFAGAAQFLGITVPSLRTAARRANHAGILGMPKPDQRLGRSPGWRLRTIVVHRAALTGRGARGLSKPNSGRRKQDAAKTA